MAGQVTIPDLENAKLDCETIAAVATSTDETVEDRLGNEKLTLTGAILRIGYAAPVVYTNGLSMTSGIQTVEHDDAIYAAKPSEVPFTTSGTFEASKFLLLDSSTATQQATAAAASAADAAADAAAALAAVTAQNAGRLINTQIFSANGTWTKPAGASAGGFVRIRGVGGGGAGGGASTASSNSSMADGGSAGAFAEIHIPLSSIAATAAVVIGAGGTGVSGAAGNNGAATTFTSSSPTAVLTFPGGYGGGVTAAGTAAEVSGGPTAASPATSNFTSGVFVLPSNSTAYTDAAPAMRLAATTAVGGSGEGSGFFPAGGGRCYAPSGSGVNPTGAGCGGGGTATSSTAKTGGTGASGYLIVETYA